MKNKIILNAFLFIVNKCYFTNIVRIFDNDLKDILRELKANIIILCVYVNFSSISKSCARYIVSNM